MNNKNNIILSFKEYIDEYIHRLDVEINKTQSKISRDKSKIKILEYTYGLKSKYYSREEISFLLEMTSERVRQIGVSIINDIRKDITSQEDNIFYNDFFKKINELKNNLTHLGVLSQSGFKKHIETNFNINDLDDPYLKLLIDVLEFKVVKTHLHLLKDNDLIFFDKLINVKQFIRVCYIVFVAIEKNTILTELEDIIISVRREFKKERVPTEYISMALKAIDSCELIINEEKEFYQIAFNKLSSSSDMAYRILFEKKDQMNLSDIFKEINFRLNNTGRKKLDKASLQQQLNMDKRFTPLGKSGHWTLVEWGKKNASIYDLITNTLIHFNEPLTRKEIFEHLQKSRPFLKIRSLDTYLYDSRYLKLNDKKFILQEWKNLYKDLILKTVKRNLTEKENKIPEQIKNQIINLFKDNNSQEILLSTVVKIIRKKFNFPKHSIYRVISEETIFETIPIDTYRKKIILKNNVEMKKTKKTTTSVFISYSWNSDNYKEKVISFVNFLREKGFEADMDIKLMQEESSIDFNRLMHKGILEYDKIIILLSENYKSKAESFQGGVGKEYKFIINDFEKHQKKYILSSFEEITSQTIEKICPIEFKGREILDLVKDEKDNFEKLFAKLTETQKYVFSDVASETPIIENKKIEKFTLK